MIRSAEEFLNKIKTLRVEEDESMVSFDVTSLFTSIPRELAISALRDRLENTTGFQHQDSLQTDDILQLVEVCLNTYFTFQGSIYEQIKGTPMGSPISSIIAEVVLQQIELKAMASYQPKFWVRYVDDTFAVVKKQHVADFMGILNSICSDVQFTVEEERQGHLPFLDVSIYRQPGGQLYTGVYRKSTHTDRILHFRSNHPRSHKVSCIKTLFKRVDSHCSTEELKRKERKHLSRICQRNGYPWRFVRQYGLVTHPQGNRKREEPSPRNIRITLPYINDVSEATARLLAPYGVRVAHRPNQTLRSKIMRPKDPLPTMDKSAIVYKINCQDCDGNYVGETAKRLGTRIHEHELAVKRGEQHSQLWMHVAQHDHWFDFSNACVLSGDATKSGRLLKEAWYSDTNSLNRHIDLHPAQLALRKWQQGRQINHRKQLDGNPNYHRNVPDRSGAGQPPPNARNPPTTEHPPTHQHPHDGPPACQWGNGDGELWEIDEDALRWDTGSDVLTDVIGERSDGRAMRRPAHVMGCGEGTLQSTSLQTESGFTTTTPPHPYNTRRRAALNRKSDRQLRNIHRAEGEGLDMRTCPYSRALGVTGDGERLLGGGHEVMSTEGAGSEGGEESTSPCNPPTGSPGKVAIEVTGLGGVAAPCPGTIQRIDCDLTGGRRDWGRERGSLLTDRAKRKEVVATSAGRRGEEDACHGRNRSRKGVTQKDVRGNCMRECKETSRTQIDRPGPVTRSMSRAQRPANPI